MRAIAWTPGVSAGDYSRFLFWFIVMCLLGFHRGPSCALHCVTLWTCVGSVMCVDWGVWHYSAPLLCVAALVSSGWRLPLRMGHIGEWRTSRIVSCAIATSRSRSIGDVRRQSSGGYIGPAFPEYHQLDGRGDHYDFYLYLQLPLSLLHLIQCLHCCVWELNTL